MFFINRYQTKYIEFRDTIKEIRSWSFSPTKNAVSNKLEKFLFLDEKSRNILLSKLSFILKYEKYLDLDDIQEINLFLKRRLGLKDDILDKQILDYPSIEAIFTETFSLNNGHQYEIFNDPLFITIIEIILVFVKDDKYKKIQNEFSEIFDKYTNLHLKDYLVFFDTLPDLKNQLHLIKDEKLKLLLKNFYINEYRDNYQKMAKISADIIKKIFYPKPNNKKEKVTEKILINSFKIEKKRKKERKLIKEYLENRFDFITQVIDKIYNIRHTEDWTIEVKDDYVYKMVSSSCIDFITLYIKSNRGKYFRSLEKTKQIRKKYYEEFERYIPKVSSDEYDDLPF